MFSHPYSVRPLRTGGRAREPCWFSVARNISRKQTSNKCSNLFLPNFWGRPFWSFLEMVGSRPNRPLRTPGLLLRPVISLGDLLQLWHPTSHLHWRSRAMIRQSLHSPPHWGPQFLDPDIFRTESPSSTVRHKSPSQQILKSKHVLESQGDVLEKSQGRHITKIQFKG